MRDLFSRAKTSKARRQILVCRGYRINPKDGSLEVSAVTFGHSEKILCRKMKKRPGVKKVTIGLVKPEHEDTIITEGLV
jgi:hypothetical protein